MNAILDVDVARRAGRAPVDLARAYLSGGARFVQLRAKGLSGAALLDLASRLAELTRAAAALLIVNDRADIARLSGADGVHVGQDDLTPTAARSLVGTEAIVGLSSHTEAQIDAAAHEPIDYLAVGPVFGTTTKATGYSAVGLELVRYAVQSRRDTTIVAIGGITLERAADAIRAGAGSVAVITDLLIGGDPERRVRDYVARLDELDR